MADLGEDFDPESVEPRESLDPVPAGVYAVEIVESDVVDTKSGTGRMVKLTHKIMEGSYEGRLIWDNINFRNENEVAQRIGQQAIAELCAACGHRGPLRDTELLHGIPMKIRVTIQEDKSGQYGPRNNVRNYMPYDDGGARPAAPSRPAASASRQAAAAAPARAPASGSRPWGNAAR